MHSLDFVARRDQIMQWIPLPHVLLCVLSSYITDDWIASRKLPNRFCVRGIHQDTVYWTWGGVICYDNGQFQNPFAVHRVTHVKDQWFLMNSTYDRSVMNKSTNEVKELSIFSHSVLVWNHMVCFIHVYQAFSWNIDTGAQTLLAKDISRLTCIGNQLTLHKTNNTCYLYGHESDCFDDCYGLYSYQHKIVVIDVQNVENVYGFGHLLFIDADESYVWDLKHNRQTSLGKKRNTKYYADETTLYEWSPDNILVFE